MVFQAIPVVGPVKIHRDEFMVAEDAKMMLYRCSANAEFEHQDRFEIARHVFATGEDLNEATPNRLRHHFIDMHANSLVSLE
ncbi:MAG: hypothetical protein V4531_12745 [Actinomycetota bacterium]